MDTDIKYKDIDTISYALCCANALLDMKIKSLEEKGFKDVANEYKSNRHEVEEAQKSLQKIRKELHLSDDYAYNEKFRS